MSIDKVYKEAYPRIFAYFFAKTGNRQQAEDLTQEVFYQAIKNFHTFSGHSSVETWLFAIARNCLRNFYRRKKYRELLLKKISPHEVHHGTPEEEVIKKEKKKTLMDAVSQLEDLPKEIVALRVYGELSFKEIAALVNKSESHTRIIFHRAKLKILKELDDVQDG